MSDRKKLKPANQNPDFGKVCIHGSLKRQCYTCELEENNDWLKKVNQNLRDEIEKLKEAIRRKDGALEEYVRHTDVCILSRWEGGEPTKDGGYRSQYAGKWYQSRPIDETPKCNCGLEEALKDGAK